MTQFSLRRCDSAPPGLVLSCLAGCWLAIALGSALPAAEPEEATDSPVAVADDKPGSAPVDSKSGDSGKSDAEQPSGSEPAAEKQPATSTAKDSSDSETKRAIESPRRAGSRSGRASEKSEKGSKPKADDEFISFKPTADSLGVIDPNDPDARKLSFNARFAPWESVLRRFAEEADLQLDMSAAPDGTFNYYDDGLYTPAEALDILNAYLSSRGVLLFRRDKFLVVVELENGIPPNLIPRVPVSELARHGNFEFMSVVMQLPQGDTQAILDDVKEFLGPYGKVVALRANQLLVSDFGSNLRAIVNWLSELGVVQNPKGTNFRSFKIVHVTAGEAERMVRDLFNLPARGASRTSTTTATPAPNQQQDDGRNRRGGGGNNPWGGGGNFGGGNWGGGGGPWGGGGQNAFAPGGGGPWGGGAPPQWGGGQGGPGGGGGGDRGDRRGNDQQPQQANAAAAAGPKILMTIDSRTNSLLVTANHDDMLLIEQLITTIDVPQGPAVRVPVARGLNVPQLEAFVVENVDMQVVVDLLSATAPGVTGVYPDSRTRRLFVYAPPDDLAQVRQIIKSLDRPGDGWSDTVAAIPLRKYEAINVVTTLRGLFPANRGDGPSIEANSLGRQVIVRGTPEQVAQVKKALAGMGEDGNLSDPAGSKGGPVRKVDVGTRSPEELLALVQQFMPKSEGTFIRVLPPSNNGIPSFRPRTTEYDRGLRDKDAEGDSDADERVPPRRGGAMRPEPGRPGLLPAGAAIPARPSANRSNISSPRGNATKSEESVSADRRSKSAELERLSRDLESALEADDLLEEEADPDEPLGANDAPPEPAAEEKVSTVAAAVPAQAPESPDPATDQLPLPDEVTATAYGGKILLYSENEAALDRLEDLLQTLVQVAPAKSKWQVYFMRSADATETASVLGSLFPTGSVARTAEQSNSGIFGGLTSGLSTLGSNLASASGVGSLSQAEPLRIVPEPRMNALFISGGTDQVNEVLQALEVLDTAELPASLKDRTARMIVVEHADVEEVAEIVRDVYKEQLEPPQPVNPQQGQGGRGGPGGFNPFAALLGGGAPQGKQKGVLLSIGVDMRTSTLIVSAADPLFREVETLVKSLDQSAYEARKTVRVMQVSSAGSQLVQEALRPLLGKVRVSTTGSIQRLGDAPREQRQQQPQFGQFGGGFNPAMMMMLQQQRGGGGGGGGGGGNPFGQFNPGQFGGGQSGQQGGRGNNRGGGNGGNRNGGARRNN